MASLGSCPRLNTVVIDLSNLLYDKTVSMTPEEMPTQDQKIPSIRWLPFPLLKFIKHAPGNEQYTNVLALPFEYLQAGLTYIKLEAQWIHSACHEAHVFVKRVEHYNSCANPELRLTQKYIDIARCMIAKQVFEAMFGGPSQYFPQNEPVLIDSEKTKPKGLLSPIAKEVIKEKSLAFRANQRGDKSKVSPSVTPSELTRMLSQIELQPGTYPSDEDEALTFWIDSESSAHSDR